MKKEDKLLIFLLATAFLMLIYKIDKPFWGQFDWTGAWFGTIARNYLDIGYLTTKLAPITVSGTVNPSEWEYYNHYSVFYPLLTSFSLLLFGVHEWSVRIVSTVFSLGILAAFYLICRRFLSAKIGLTGTLTIIFTPMFIYYGKLPVHEQPVIFFSLLSLFYYFLWSENSRKKNLALMTIFSGLSFAVSWTGFYMLLMITVHLFLTNRKVFLKIIYPHLLVFSIFILHFAHIFFTSSFQDFATALFDRTSTSVSLVVFVQRQVLWLLALYTKPLVIISLFNLLSLVILNIKKPKYVLKNTQFQILLILFVWGFFQWLIAKGIAAIHDYMLIYFLPFIGLSTGLFFEKIAVKHKAFSFLGLAVVLLLSLKTSLPFSLALLNSRDQTGDIYEIANYIRVHSSFGDKILVAVKPGADFEIHYPSHYFSYYSNRFIKYQFTKTENIGEEYKFIVVPVKYGDADTETFLRKKYKARDFHNFHLYEI